MKVLRIRLTNLNSLKGTHEIDLTREPLASSGLFVITGPTGAGKTTLLDAITLALYGKAARYGTDSHPEHVMTRRCGECSAEVEFEVRSGVFRAVWQRHRSRKKSDGALQPPKRYVYNSDGEPIAQQIREAEEKIVELIGLNYDRFLRSVLFAQGDFARFLKANANERAEVLESLTGTVIYSQLGILAQTEAAQREKEYELQEAELGKIETLDEDDRSELMETVRQGDEQAKTLSSRIEAGSILLAKIDRLEKARQKESEASAKHAEFLQLQEDSRRELEQLERHRSTVQFSEPLADLDAAEESLKTAVVNRDRAVKKQSEQRKLLTEAKEILCASVSASLVRAERNARDARETMEKETLAMEKASQWLAENQRDADLTNRINEVVPALADFKNTRSTLAEIWSFWKEIGAEVMEGFERSLPSSLDSHSEPELLELMEHALASLHLCREKAEQDLKQLSEQLDFRKDHLHKSQLVAHLKDHRHELVSGQPCPLCGALEHPYADGESVDSELKTLQAKVDEASERHAAGVRYFDQVGRAVERLEAGRKKVIEKWREVQAQQAKAASVLTLLELKLPKPGEEETLLEELRRREKDYRDHEKLQRESRQRSVDAERVVGEAVGIDKTLREMLIELVPEGQGPQLQLLPEEDLPDVTEALEAFETLLQAEQAAVSRADERKRVERSAIARLKKCDEQLRVAVEETTFKTIDGLRQARLTPETASQFASLEQRVNDGITAAKAVLQETRRDIEELLQQDVLEGEFAREWKLNFGQLREESDRLIELQTTRRNQLRMDDENRRRRREVEKALEAERKGLTVWRRLRELIGSHDGSKFRRYAQSISLDILTRHANRHLELLSDRYLIRRDESEALNLQIQDLHQAGTRRPMASLSGGESFLVSLALALGLSELAGRNVRIDSLFIDEGFGTLDPETLEIALAALESLRQNEKTVGLISHVEILKDRISTQIVVEKGAGGFSTLHVIPEVEV